MKALVVIDMQNDFITGSLANSEAQKIVDPICNLIKSGQFDKIIFTRDTHDWDYLNTPEGKKLPVEHCIKNTAGWCIEDKLLKTAGDTALYVDKKTFAYDKWGINFPAFNHEDVELTLVGTCTDICVVSNALVMKSVFPRAKISVIVNLCAGTTLENHRAAIDIMEACQVEIEIGV